MIEFISLKLKLVSLVVKGNLSQKVAIKTDVIQTDKKMLYAPWAMDKLDAKKKIGYFSSQCGMKIYTLLTSSVVYVVSC